MKRVKTVLFMVVITAVFGAGVTGLNLASRKTVEQNQQIIEQRALVELFGLGNVDTLSNEEIANIVKTQIVTNQTFQLETTDPATGQPINVLEAYESAEKNKLKAYGFKFIGIGFWTTITGYIAVDSTLNKTVGLKVISQAETPGLGARIEEAFFVKPFEDGLDITAPAPGASYLYMGTPGSEPESGTPQYGRTFDAITGATQTSLAMERMLNAAIAEFGRCIQNRK